LALQATSHRHITQRTLDKITFVPVGQGQDHPPQPCTVAHDTLSAGNTSHAIAISSCVLGSILPDSSFRRCP